MMGLKPIWRLYLTLLLTSVDSLVCTHMSGPVIVNVRIGICATTMYHYRRAALSQVPPRSLHCGVWCARLFYHEFTESFILFIRKPLGSTNLFLKLDKLAHPSCAEFGAQIDTRPVIEYVNHDNFYCYVLFILK